MLLPLLPLPECISRCPESHWISAFKVNEPNLAEIKPVQAARKTEEMNYLHFIADILGSGLSLQSEPKNFKNY